MHEEHPDLIPDIHWDDSFPPDLPYTVAAEPFRTEAPQGSTFNMELADEEMEIIMPVLEEEEEEDVGNSDVKVRMFPLIIIASQHNLSL